MCGCPTPRRQSLDRLEEQDRAYRRGAVDHPRERGAARTVHRPLRLAPFERRARQWQPPDHALPFPGRHIGPAAARLRRFARDGDRGHRRRRSARSAASGSPQLIAEHPRLGALILGLTVADRVALADRLASIGRTSARARVGSLICEIFARMRRLGAADEGDGIQLPLTQEDIGDATGLTAVHVNRMMRALVEDGIIERNGGQIRLLDEKPAGRRSRTSSTAPASRPAGSAGALPRTTPAAGSCRRVRPSPACTAAGARSPARNPSPGRPWSRPPRRGRCRRRRRRAGGRGASPGSHPRCSS